MFLLILKDGEKNQNAGPYLEICFNEIYIEYEDKFIAVGNEKTIRLKWKIKKLIKEITQDSKNISNIVIKFIFKNGSLY